MKKTLSKAQAVEVLDRLSVEYPDARCQLDHVNVFQLLVATVLSAQTTDVSVNQVTPALFKAYPDPAALGAAAPEDVEQYIKRIGMYHQKAKNIVMLAQRIEQDFDGEVPRSRADLESLPGVGRKTANVVLAEGFGEQQIAVDTHVFRVANRIGLTRNSKTPLQTEKELVKHIPEEKLAIAHHWLILHGRYVCQARKPHCAECGIAELCNMYKKQCKTAAE